VFFTGISAFHKQISGQRFKYVEVKDCLSMFSKGADSVADLNAQWGLCEKLILTACFMRERTVNFDHGRNVSLY
jgi:hypothetical protein